MFYGPEAANLGDLMRLWVRSRVRIVLFLGFSRAAGSTPNSSQYKRLHPPLFPISRQDNSRDYGRWEEKITLLGASTSVSKLQIVTEKYPLLGGGMLITLPFASSDKPHCRGLPCRSGTAIPCAKAVHMEPFSTSIFDVHIWIFATTTKICNRYCFTRTNVLSFTTIPMPSYALILDYYINGWKSITRFNAIHFRG